MSDHFAQYFGGVTVECGTSPTSYDVTVTPGYESDRLVPGHASHGSWVSYYASGKCYGRRNGACAHIGEPRCQGKVCPADAHGLGFFRFAEQELLPRVGQRTI